ncbi:MAG: biotin/lipoate A/B protein ligase family protein [Anaerolineales bacterium]
MSAHAYPPAVWRLLREERPNDGAYNLAVDEAILRAVVAQLAPPTLRLYTWEPAVTLGRGQPVADIAQEVLRAHGYRLLRRPTGGTAVLHGDELTYSVAVPDDDPRVAGDIVASYRRLSRPILSALRAVGVSRVAAMSHSENRRMRSPVCFEISSDYEITVDDRKLVGSAQMRVRGGILQHGSIPLSGDIAHIGELLVARIHPERIRGRATTLEEALRHPISRRTLEEALVSAFGEILNLELQPGSLLLEERMVAERLVAEKYGNRAWTARH